MVSFPKFVCRKAYCPGNRAKPALVIDASFALYIGNEGEEEMTLECSELAGFNTGQFEEKAVAGSLAPVKVSQSMTLWLLVRHFKCFIYTLDLCVIVFHLLIEEVREKANFPNHWTKL